MNGTAVLFYVLTTSIVPAADPPSGRLDLDAEDVRPGLVAEYRSIADPKASVTRMEAEAGLHTWQLQPASAHTPWTF